MIGGNPEQHFNRVMADAFNSNLSGKQRVANGRAFLDYLRYQVGDEIVNDVIRKYQLQHLNKLSPQMSINDVRALLVGIATNIKPEHLNGLHTVEFLERNSADINQMAKEQRKSLAASMDKVVLQKVNPVAGFFMRVGKAISDRSVKSNDLKDAFAGKRIHKAFEEDIKTVATFEYANTYKADYVEPQENGNEVSKGISADEMIQAVADDATRKSLASGLYLASDLAYRNLNNHAVISVLDDDGTERLYQVHNLVKDKGLVCTALVPYTGPGSEAAPHVALDVKVMFRGTHSAASANVDLESTGAGSKTMRDSRIKLLDEVNELVANVMLDNPQQPVAISVHGHSLGGAFAERFTSELHQAIHYTNTGGSAPTPLQPANVQARIKRNNREMADKDYSALAALSGITTTAANSARLSKEEARVGDAFINMTTVQQNIQHFKSRGDWVSQAGNRSLGVDIDENRAHVMLLSKNVGYGGVKSLHPVLGHCDHPFMQYHDKQQRNLSFVCHNNQDNRDVLVEKLSSGRKMNKVAQHLYSKMPTAVAEPLTWARRKVAKAIGQDHKSIKGFEVQTVKEKEESKNRRRH